MAEKKPQKSLWQPALTIFAEVTGWIVAPVIIALFLGKYLDEKYHTEPWLFLGLTAMAFVISCIGIVIVAGRYIRQIERENKEKLIKQNKLTKSVKEGESTEREKDE